MPKAVKKNTSGSKKQRVSVLSTLVLVQGLKQLNIVLLLEDYVQVTIELILPVMPLAY